MSSMLRGYCRNWCGKTRTITCASSALRRCASWGRENRTESPASGTTIRAMKNSIHGRFGKTLGAMRRHAEMLAALALAAALFCPEASAKFPPRAKQARSSPSGQREQAARTPRISEERADVMPTREGLRLRLMADQGNVNILTVRPGAGKVQVSYRVRIETDARTPRAKELLRRYVLSVRSTSSGVQIAGEMPKEALRDGAASNAGADSPRISVAFEVSVPFQYSLDVQTRAGDIETDDINGSVSLLTYGGNIPAGHIAGKAEIETGGGNISVQQAGGSVSVATTGGQIDFGEASGSVRAHTGGGGIRILHVAGPIQLETSDGSICLTRVQGAVRAATGSGTITAWINPMEAAAPRPPAAPRVVRLLGASQLESGQGDIVVFLPRELAANIEATIEMAADHHIEADPSLPLKISYGRAGGPRGANTVRAEGVLNGGGEWLRLKTISGNIRLQFFDADPALQQLLVRQQRGRLERQKLLLQQRLLRMRRVIAQEQPADAQASQADAPEAQSLQIRQRDAPEVIPAESRLEEWSHKLEVVLWDSIRLAPEELRKRVVTLVQPTYSEVARSPGIEGTLRLEIVVSQDGKVQVRKALEGSPVLREAAASAVKQWRYHPVLVDGKAVNAISTVAFEFQLR